MRRSEQRILTTHVGSLPDPADLQEGTPGYESILKRSVGDVVKQQRDLGGGLHCRGPEFAEAVAQQHADEHALH